MTTRTPRPRSDGRTTRGSDALGIGGVILALLAGSGVAIAIASGPGCSRGAPPGATRTGPSSTVATIDAAPPPAAAVSSSPLPLAALDASTADASVENEGPLAATIVPQAFVYAGPSGKEVRLGYLRRGAKVAVDPTLVSGKGCDDGWYRLRTRGFVCAKNLSLDLSSPQVRLGLKDPSIDDILPYKYAFNVAHGTPLYRNVPTRDEMAEYEPYLKLKHREPTANEDPPNLPKKKRKKKKKHDTREPAPADDATAMSPETTPNDAKTSDAPDAGAAPAAVTTAAATTADASTLSPLPDPASPADAGADAESDDERPWWQRKYEVGKNPDIKLSDLVEGADETLAKRMVRGFYVAVDRAFIANGRTWYKTTTGLVAPADRFSVVKPPSFAGQEIDDAHAGNQVAFIVLKEATKYELDTEKKTLKVVGGLVRYDRAFLTGKTAQHAGKTFRETTDGFWIQEGVANITEPGPPPASLKPGEKWIDVNLTRQTLVAFEGDKPVFATLVSSGRKGKDKEHDHTTPTGTWRIREKHVTATMDGDGAAAGDLPYSIEDVPYVMYFHESYALHGAFWHDGFGRPMSHGCVNLAPSDAKRLFFWTTPALPPGWHGAMSSEDLPGTIVVVHE